MKPYLNKLGIRPLRWLVDLSLISAPKPILSEEFRNELIAEFSEDVKLLEKLLNRDLSGWLRPVYRVRSLSA